MTYFCMFFALVLANEICTKHVGFAKYAEHVLCILWYAYFFVEIAETFKSARMMISYAATATSLPLGPGAILFFFFTDMAPRPGVFFLLCGFANLWPGFMGSSHVIQVILT